MPNNSNTSPTRQVIPSDTSTGAHLPVHANSTSTSPSKRHKSTHLSSSTPVASSAKRPRRATTSLPASPPSSTKLPTISPHSPSTSTTRVPRLPRALHTTPLPHKPIAPSLPPSSMHSHSAPRDNSATNHLHAL